MWDRKERDIMDWFNDKGRKKGFICGMLVLFILVLGGCFGKENKTAVSPDSDEDEARVVLDTDKAGNEENPVQENPGEGEEAQGNEEAPTEGVVPVYSLADKKEIKKYLAGLTGKWEKAEKEEGIISIGHDGIMTEEELELWDGFWAGETDAVVILNPTIEGDLIYNYLSRTEAGYTQYCDMSRDMYGGGYSFGEYAQVYREEKKEKDSDCIEEEKNYRISYYLFGTADGRELTDREMKRALKYMEQGGWEENGDDIRICWLVSYKESRQP